MGVLKSADRERVRLRLSSLTSPVKLVHFTQAQCGICTDRARAVVEELASESGNLSVQFVDFTADPEAARRYGVTQVPATVITGPRAPGLRFDGAPEGVELDPFLDGITAVAEGAAEDRLAVLASPPTRDLVPSS